MIQINKGPAPISLNRAKNKYNKINGELYQNAPQAYDNGSEKFNFTGAYNSKEVKETLMRVQFEKCCFSEAKFVMDEPHVEHFRPKGRVDGYPEGQTTYPGYYWLAYEWSNLFLCKSIINSSVKRNFFPLMGNGQRNRNHTGAIVEQSILIDPSNENPRDHIRFKSEEIIGVTSRGLENIKILQLRNPQLDEDRRKYYRFLRFQMSVVEIFLNKSVGINDPQVVIILNDLRNATNPSSEFSSMAIDLLQGWPHLK